MRADMSAQPPAITSGITSAAFQPPMLDLFWTFICERQRVWQRRKQEGLPPPWTTDEILQRERFTNIYRELDPGTQYVINQVLEADAPKPDKVFNTMLYRLIGRAETHATLGFQYLSTFDPEQMQARLQHIRDVEGKPPFTAAYMVSAYASMGSHDKTVNVTRLFDRLHQRFSGVYTQIEQSGSPADIHHILAAQDGFGNFLAYQVLVDLLYPLKRYDGRPLLPFTHDDWASAGPGAVRGVRMLLAKGVHADDLEVMRWLRWNQRSEFTRLGLDFPFLRIENGPEIEISLANIQNCLCEYHKYVKIRDGVGRGRRKFHTAEDAAQAPASPKRNTRRRALGRAADAGATQLGLFDDTVQ
jgi:hypothetical protein